MISGMSFESSSRQIYRLQALELLHWAYVVNKLCYLANIDFRLVVANLSVFTLFRLNVVVQGLGVYLLDSRLIPEIIQIDFIKVFLLMQQQQQQYNGPIYSTPSSCCLAAANATHHNIRQICMTCLVVSHLGETMICLLKTQLWLSQWAKNGKKCIIIRSTHMCQGGMTWHYIRLLIIAE